MHDAFYFLLKYYLLIKSMRKCWKVLVLRMSSKPKYWCLVRSSEKGEIKNFSASLCKFTTNKSVYKRLFKSLTLIVAVQFYVQHFLLNSALNHLYKMNTIYYWNKWNRFTNKQTWNEATAQAKNSTEDKAVI